MTSRLKRKLGDIGVDTSSRKANENFCLIGTPLPPLEKSKDTGEFVPLWKQEVRDEKGRRRLHGAFTGGFSAGYFNTVGSKEGWTPQTFVSSRNDRAKKPSARPEDFMDEEDLQDHKDDLNLVDTTEQMDFMGGTQAELRGKIDEDESEKDPITRTLEASLLPTPMDSVGAKILKKMGWRLGQGIGPRISFKQRKLQDAQAYDAASGTKSKASKLDIPVEDEEASKHTYAPRDTPILVVQRKENTHGLGYSPGMGLNESLGSNTAGSSKGPRLAGGFGLGALNDADEDDLDVYDNDPQRSRRRVAYDHLDKEEDDTVVIGGTSDKRKAPIATSNLSIQHFRDGRPVLAGFVFSNEPVAEDRWFPLPEIPPGWKPDPRVVWGKDKENVQAPPLPRQPDVQPHAKWKKSAMSADQRGSMLGETPLPPGPRSVFDYMSEKDRERIQRISSSLASGRGSSTTDREHLPPPPPVSTAKIEPHVAEAALRGFQPFTADRAKQARYTIYLQSQTNTDGSVHPLKPLANQSPDEFNKELEDYGKAASLFKPMSGAMAGRFTSAAVVDFGPNVVEGLHMPTSEELEAKEAQRKEEEEKVTPMAHAAKLGMYGPMTREAKSWVPARLLCKRFGVKEPEVAMEMPDTAGQSGESASASSFTQPDLPGPSSSSVKDVTVPAQKKDGPRDLSNIGFGEDETQGQDTLTYQRPSMDIFKAIFASDDEDSDDDDDKVASDREDELLGTTQDGVKDQGTGFTRANLIADNTPVDLDTFKPTFIPREGKSKQLKGDKSKEKKEKKKKDKEAKRVLISFEMDEGGGDDAEPKQPKDRPPKKKKRKEGGKGSEDANDQVMWADKLALGTHPTSVSMVSSLTPPVQDNDTLSALGAKSRKRAVDFMD